MSNATDPHIFPEPLSQGTGEGKEATEKGRVGREVPFKSEKQQRETGGVRSMGDVVVRQQLIFFLLSKGSPLVSGQIEEKRTCPVSLAQGSQLGPVCLFLWSTLRSFG